MSVNLILFFVILFNSLCTYNDVDEIYARLTSRQGVWVGGSNVIEYAVFQLAFVVFNFEWALNHFLLQVGQVKAEVIFAECSIPSPPLRSTSFPGFSPTRRTEREGE